MAKQQKSGSRCSSICWLIAAIAGGALIYEFWIQLQQEILTSLLAGFGGMVLVGMVLGRLLCRGDKAKADNAKAVVAEGDAADPIRPKRYNELKVDKETTERPDVTAAATAGAAGLAGVAELDPDDPAEEETAVAVQPVKPVKTPITPEAKPSGDNDGDGEVERVVASIKRAANGEAAESAPADAEPDQPETAQPEGAVEDLQAMFDETALEPAADDDAAGTETATSAEADSETALEMDAETDFEADLEKAVETPAAAQDAAAKAKAVADRIKAIASEVEAAEAEDLAAYALAEKVAVPDASRVYTTAIDTDEAFHQKLATLTTRAEAEAQQNVNRVEDGAGQEDDTEPTAEQNVEPTAEPEPDQSQGYSDEMHAADATPATDADEPAETDDTAPAEPDIAEVKSAPPQPVESPQKRAIVPMEPNGLDQPIDGMADDLTQIDGIGAIQQTALNRAGIYHFAQFTSMNRRELAWLDANMQIEDGQPGAEAWRKQAIQISRNSG